MTVQLTYRHNQFSNLVTSYCLVFSLLLVSFPMWASNQVTNVRVWPTPESTRVVFDISDKPNYKYFTLSSPERLVIDFYDSKSKINFKNIISNDKRITKIRTSKPKNKQSMRVVFELAANYQFSVFPIAPAGQYGDRLVIDIVDNKQLADVEPIKDANRNKNIVVAIIAGHGGDDPGSIGYRGTYEKGVTLTIAKKLAKLIEKDHYMQSVMLREGDYYVTHAQKPKLARRHQADLLISIHADAFTSPKPSGASVLVQSTKRANSEFTRMIKNREKTSELLGGAGQTIKHTKDSNLAIALADMTKDHTMKSSYEFATDALAELKKVTKLHKKKPTGLSLAVLKAPDIPSVLIETGFISNPNDEKNLNNPVHQDKLANAIYQAVRTYFNRTPPRGTLLASTQLIEHQVNSGESLSLLASRYKVSVKSIKEMNNLRSNTIHIGQVLKIDRPQ